MHGLIFAELKKYVDAKLGPSAWDALAEQAGLRGKIYTSVREYPDEEILALVTTACRLTGLEATKILEDFGEFMVPSLLELYGALIDPGWRTLDVIEHTESTIHRVVRLRNPGARPPELSARRVGSGQVELTYSSGRKMCGVAKGIVRGLAGHFGERVTVDETSCMLAGAPACQMVIRA
jgi:predicted hydrocarbon binding protein